MDILVKDGFLFDVAKKTVKTVVDGRFTVVLREEDVGFYSVQCVELL